MSPEELENAVVSLLSVNGYECGRHVQIHGANVDVVARQKNVAFPVSLYAECTISYVDNNKYGKDLSKLALVKEKERSSRLVIISLQGFTPDVIERSKETGVECLTYSQFLARFERVDAYIESVLTDEFLGGLNSIYEEADLYVGETKQRATDYLTRWLADESAPKWLFILGEYGTGKTALSQVLQYRWGNEFFNNPISPIPFRIELRSFNKQFDAFGLIQAFLYRNRLRNIPIDYAMSLIKSGRIVLILDGYDEMAMYMNIRERRSCLQALAELSSDGARGIITSRPNYFTIDEELRIFEVLYRDFEEKSKGRIVPREERGLEKNIDHLITQQFLVRHEYVLSDLSPEQTEALIRRKLLGKPDKVDLLLRILRRAFKRDDDGAKTSLSGKPVIISYLLDVVEEIVLGELSQDDDLTEWDIYHFIITMLMRRDSQIAIAISISGRRDALHSLAFELSRISSHVADEEMLRAIIKQQFRRELQRFESGERKRKEDEYFEDLRRSATLTRSDESAHDGWRFSHNSLREFLVCEGALNSLAEGDPWRIEFPISDAMRRFFSSKRKAEIASAFEQLVVAWTQRSAHFPIGKYLELAWDGLSSLSEKEGAGKQSEKGRVLFLLESRDLSFQDITASNLEITFDAMTKVRTSFSGAELASVKFKNCHLADMRNALLDGVVFENCDFSSCNFSGAWLVDCRFINCNLSGGLFTSMDRDSQIAVDQRSDVGGKFYTGAELIGLLRFKGAITDDVDEYYVFCHHPKYSIVYKIMTKLGEQAKRQLLGLTQKGAAREDPVFASDFVNVLYKNGLIEFDRHDLVSPTPEGRDVIARFLEARTLDPAIAEYLRGD